MPIDVAKETKSFLDGLRAKLEKEAADTVQAIRERATTEIVQINRQTEEQLAVLTDWYRTNGFTMSDNRVAITHYIDHTVSDETVQTTRRKRFTPEEIRDIRTRYGRMGRNPRPRRIHVLAQDFGSTYVTIQKIVDRETYIHV